MKGIFYISLLSLSLCASCGEQKNGENVIEGNLTLLADHASMPVLQSEADVFNHFYKKARVNIVAMAEDSALTRFLQGKVASIAISRDLDEDERKFLSASNISPQTYKIGRDGLAFLSSRQKQDSSLTIEELEGLLSGKITSWKELGAEGGQVSLVISHNASSDINFLSRTLKISPSVKIFAAGTSEKLVKYLEEHPDAIGILGISALMNIPAPDEHLKKLRVLSIKNREGRLTYPFQEDLSAAAYPFTREIYVINKFRSGLGTGFASYVLSEDGQRIVLKSGLLPAVMPGREVIIKKDF